jgi:hypothetical protein
MAGFRRLGPRPTPIPELRTWVEWQLMGLSPTAACREEYIRELQRPSLPRKAKSTTPCTEGDDEGAREVELWSCGTRWSHCSSGNQEMCRGDAARPARAGDSTKAEATAECSAGGIGIAGVGATAMHADHSKHANQGSYGSKAPVRNARATPVTQPRPARHHARGYSCDDREVWVELGVMKRRYKLPHRSAVRALCRMWFTQQWHKTVIQGQRETGYSCGAGGRVAPSRKI